MRSVQTYYDSSYDSSVAATYGTNGGGGFIKLNSLDLNNQVSNISYFYASGYLKYYYSNGYYYEYADNQTRTPITNDSNVYISRTAFTNDQALAKINELKAL